MTTTPGEGQRPTEQWQAGCCIVGGGPAGMMLGLLLARAGVDVVVLEKHGDFLRDFRGDTIHPSTLELIHELGLLEAFLRRPHQEVAELRGVIDGFQVTLADLRHLPTRCRFIAFMPQWDFLDFLAEHAKGSPTFRLRMRAEATELIEDAGVVRGVRATTPEGPLEVRAALTVGADGRHSTVRALSNLRVRELGVPIDVLWMRISRREDDPAVPLGRIERGRILVMIYRGDYWQCGFVIPKGGIEELQRRGLQAFREELALAAPFLRERLGELRTWDDIKLLTVKVDRLERWFRPGLLCIGDAAHAMSPVGGVGINLAIQDAVAAANALAALLRNGTVTPKQLERVQRRRVLPTRLTQTLQMFLQDRIIRPTLGSGRPVSPPWPVRLLGRWPVLRRVPARLIGVGFRAEHIRTPAEGLRRVGRSRPPATAAS
jgi:2-polyprenyl-6-methoxyphenol hydroxylase-like FAD-dependent oxidoreductase